MNNLGRRQPWARFYRYLFRERYAICRIGLQHYYINPTGSGLKIYGQVNATNHTTLSAWQAATKRSACSKRRPFLSNTDLHINTSSVTLESRGTPLASVTSDYDNDARSESFPTSSDEYTGPAPTAFTLSTPANDAINRVLPEHCSGMVQQEQLHTMCI